MDIYTRKSYWKWWLAFGGAVIILISLLYTKYLADRLGAEELHKAEQFSEAVKTVTAFGLDSAETQCDVTFAFKIIENNNTIPVVLLDENYRIESYRNLESNQIENLDTAVVRRYLNKMVAKWSDTIVIDHEPHFKKYMVYSHSRLLDLLKWYPFIQFILIAAFIAFGYLAFSASRRAEENQVWVGMAKETAHQLGTPISAIIGWIETLKLVNEENPDNTEMLHELRNDVTRLELIADRFSKIGSLPELSTVNLINELEKTRDYMKRRAPRRVVFDFPSVAETLPLEVKMNAHLFDWVMENLLRNAIDSMEKGEGKITCNVYEENGFACMDISDTGSGIPAGKFRTVFKPGYSTKKRGWGLGLSLSRRIIEDYHRGKIFVKKSEIGVGTTFTIKLPKN